MATATQLRALRKKHHLGEFRKNRKINKQHTPRKSMAHHKKRHSRRSSSPMTKGVWGTIIGVSAYVVFEAFAKPYLINIVGNQTFESLGELAIGLWLSKKSGVVGDVGKAMATLNAYVLVKSVIGGTLAPSNSSSVAKLYNGY